MDDSGPRAPSRIPGDCAHLHQRASNMEQSLPSHVLLHPDFNQDTNNRDIGQENSSVREVAGEGGRVALGGKHNGTTGEACR